MSESKSHYFSPFEICLLSFSVGLILLSALFLGGMDPLSVVASLIGVVSLIFAAKGHPVGMGLIIVFSVLYGIISYRSAYYGEMITYLGMTLPMSLYSLIMWLLHPFENHHAEVRVNRVGKVEYLILIPVTLAVTVGFFFLLRAFGTANLTVSTLSVATSFFAVYLTSRRSPYYALAYALNDVVLIVLWLIAAIGDRSYVSVVTCFIAFLANDLYGFVNWKAMEKRQAASDPS